MVQLKSGDTYQGQLEGIDKFMNIKMSDITMTSKDGDQFMHIKEMFIKGFSIKYFQLQELTVDKAIEEAEILNEQIEASKKKQQQRQQDTQRRGRGGMDRGRDRRSKTGGKGDRGGIVARGRGRGK